MALQCRGCKHFLNLFSTSRSLLIFFSLLCCCLAQHLTRMGQHLTILCSRILPMSFTICFPLSPIFPFLCTASFTFSHLNLSIRIHLSSLSSKLMSSVLLQCHLQQRSLHKRPHNLPPKLNSGETCGRGLHVWCMSVCVCVSQCRCLWGVHVSISAHDLLCVRPWISSWE